ncbi:hypothetical protein GE061_003801 [Apolygus lucorum]|uniref:Uncharacterized protein n=1 Tax=Apolygus lucorum TaxID=248454 RepID=A0A8S9X323_APOLU|nr:hypothetical protein GE061_003801 [Apolygus lucorum]
MAVQTDIVYNSKFPLEDSSGPGFNNRFLRIDQDLTFISCVSNLDLMKLRCSGVSAPRIRNFIPWTPLERLEKPTQSTVPNADTGEWAERMSKLKELNHLVEENLLKASLSQSRQYNLRRRPDRFKVGDKVLHKTFTLSSAADRIASKLNPKYEGPFIVSAVSDLRNTNIYMPSGEGLSTRLKEVFFPS